MKLSPQLVEALVGHAGEPEKLLSLFQHAGLTTPHLSRINAQSDPAHPYSRVVLSAEPACEVMLARWAPHQTCAPHDHGKSAGWVFYLDQNFEEQSYAWRSGELTPTETFLHPARTFTQVRRSEIHSCQCHGSGLSLHIYFPRIEKMHVYDLDRRQTVTVTDDCGAWLPAPAQRVREVAWA